MAAHVLSHDEQSEVRHYVPVCKKLGYAQDLAGVFRDNRDYARRREAICSGLMCPGRPPFGGS
jgi:hypothetical protein